MYEQGDLEGGAGSHSHAIAWEETITDNLFPTHSEPSTLTFAVTVFFFFFPHLATPWHMDFPGPWFRFESHCSFHTPRPLTWARDQTSVLVLQ